jgi:hypothetical protein
MSEKLDKHLEGINEDRREVVKKLVMTAAFVIPVVASFSIDGRMSMANAQVQEVESSNLGYS